MKDNKIPLIFIICALLLLVSSCGESASPDTWAGEWKAISEFGEFKYLVDITGETVYRVDYQFQSCSKAIIRGQVDVVGWIQPEDGSPIEKRKFALETTQSPVMEIRGEFTRDGSQAKGYWKAGACEGDWTAEKIREPSALQRIAFVSDRNGNDEIYSMNIYGYDVTNLTNHPASDSNPTWSPDGSKILFKSNRDGNPDIYLMNADGSELTKLTNDPGDDGSASWSPDGDRILFVSDRDGDNEIYVMNIDGSGQTKLTDNQANDFGPKWSPAGEKIAFFSICEEKRDMFIMNIDGSGQTNLSNTPEDELNYSWSPDGEQIIFSSVVLKTGDSFSNPDLFIANTDGSGIATLIEDKWWHQSNPVWSPDGSLIVYSNFDTMNATTCLIDLNHSHDDLFGCIEGGMHYNWSQDSKWIAYECYQSGSSEPDICVISIDGSQERNLTNQPVFSDTDPAWSP